MSLPPLYQSLGCFSDWVPFTRNQRGGHELGSQADLTSADVRTMLGLDEDAPPSNVRVEGYWEAGDLEGEELSWSVGYGPRTRAWLLRPARARTPLPGVLALHDHGAFKYFGREKITDGPRGPNDAVLRLRRELYGGRAFANELARQGFVVLVHDTFLWGSRRFDMDVMRRELAKGEGRRSTAPPSTRAASSAIREYNRLADRYENVIAKCCAVLGTPLAGVVAYEDAVALNYLRSRDDVVATSVGCIGLSGGGCRSALLNAVSPHISAAVVVGMMSTYDALLDHLVGSHTWMFFPAGLGGRWDWPDLASCRAPSPLMVLYAREDQLFTLAGMTTAHDRIGFLYDKADGSDAYAGIFYAGRHRFDEVMQRAAFEFLATKLSVSGAAHP